MSHLSDNCPVCHKKFVQGDDVVICPECGAPYHRACYEEHKKCVFADKHGPGFEYLSPAKKEADEGGKASESSASTGGTSRTTGGVVCKSCRTINDASHIFCEKCGNPLHGEMPKSPVGGARMGSIGGMFGGGPFGTPPMPNLTGDIEGIQKKDWVSFIGPSAPIYIARMTQMKQRGGKISFMISAFFLGPFYFVYRKMWGWAGLAALISLVLFIPEALNMLLFVESPLTAALSTATLANLQNWANIATLIFNSLCGLFALYLYQRHGIKKIHLLQKQNSEGALSHPVLAKAGGITNLGLLLSLAAIIALASLLANYIGPEGLDLYFTNYFQL